MSIPEDLDLANVDTELRRLDLDGSRIARMLRRTLDQIYDGQHTGRYRWEQLSKTEKTHFGSLVEINLQREFSFKDGALLDFSIAGADVDCKWSQSGQWMLPPEAVDQICLLITGNDDESRWGAGLVRAVESNLNFGSNRDAKKTLNVSGRAAIRWIWRNAKLPENVLLHLDPATCKSIMTDLAGPRLGQKRLNELFRRVPHRIIGRGVVATIAQQDDYMKRVRDNGGSRGHLKPEGIVIFGDYQGHREMAERLGLPKIGDGDSISARLKQIDGPSTDAIQLDDAWYRLCRAGEEPSIPAPKLPKAKRQRT